MLFLGLGVGASSHIFLENMLISIKICFSVVHFLYYLVVSQFTFPFL